MSIKYIPNNKVIISKFGIPNIQKKWQKKRKKKVWVTRSRTEMTFRSYNIAIFGRLYLKYNLRKCRKNWSRSFWEKVSHKNSKNDFFWFFFFSIFTLSVNNFLYIYQIIMKTWYIVDNVFVCQNQYRLYNESLWLMRTSRSKKKFHQKKRVKNRSFLTWWGTVTVNFHRKSECGIC